MAQADGNIIIESLLIVKRCGIIVECIPIHLIAVGCNNESRHQLSYFVSPLIIVMGINELQVANYQVTSINGLQWLVVRIQTFQT